MSILINESTRLIVQGITGRDGSFHTKKMLEYIEIYGNYMALPSL